MPSRCTTWHIKALVLLLHALVLLLLLDETAPCAAIGVQHHANQLGLNDVSTLPAACSCPPLTLQEPSVVPASWAWPLWPPTPHPEAWRSKGRQRPGTLAWGQVGAGRVRVRVRVAGCGAQHLPPAVAWWFSECHNCHNCHNCQPGGSPNVTPPITYYTSSYHDCHSCLKYLHCHNWHNCHT